MARSLRMVLPVFLAFATAATVTTTASPASAAEMDKKAKADAKEAMLYYKEGNYEDAAKIFLRLSIAYPDMLVFVRNLGACYYYMRRFEPALSNLRDYVHRKRDVAPDDRAEVEGWIGEMERLRDHPAPAAAVVPVAVPPAASGAPVASPPVAASPVGPSAPAGPEAAPSAAAPLAEPLPAPPEPSSAAAAYPSPGPAPSAYPQGSIAGSPPQGYPGAYDPQSPYASGYQPAPYAQPGAATPPAGVVMPPTSQAQSSGGSRKTVAWILAGVGAGSVLAGIYCTTAALDRFSRVEKHYDSSAEKEGKSFAVAQWVGYGLGAGLIAAAIIVGTSGGGSSSVALAPSVGPGRAGAVVSGQF